MRLDHLLSKRKNRVVESVISLFSYQETDRSLKRVRLKLTSLRFSRADKDQ